MIDRRNARLSICCLLITLAFVVLPLVTSAMLQSRVINVAPGGDVQAAINNAQPGDRIILQANGDYVAPSEGLVLPVKSSDAYITIESSRHAEIPIRGHNPLKPTAEVAAMMARIRSSHPSEPVIKAAPGAHHYKLLGLDLAPKPGGQASKVIELGTSGTTQDASAEIPHSFVIDKSWVRAATDQHIQRCIALNSGYAEITNNWITDCHAVGIDSQAIAGWNGPGPYKIINNLIEGAGENVLFGGADPSIQGLVPSDIEIRRNYFYKPMSWKVGHPDYAGIHWTVKNLYEPKASRRVVVDGNMFDGNWTDAQTGWAILIKVQNQDGGCQWCVTEDIDFINNIIKNSPNGLNVLGYDPYKPSGQVKNFRAINNLWLVDDAWFQGTGDGIMPDGSRTPDGADGVLLEHNTHLQKNGNTMTLYGSPTRRFVYRNNLGARTGYGIKGDGLSEGNPTLAKFAPGAIVEGNVLATAPASAYPIGNFYPATWEEVKLGTDYRLLPDSPFKGKATDNKDPGCDITALEAAQGGTAPTPTPSPTPSPLPTVSPSPSPTVQPSPTPQPSPSPTPVVVYRPYEFEWEPAASDSKRREVMERRAKEGWTCHPNPNGNWVYCYRRKILDGSEP